MTGRKHDGIADDVRRLGNFEAEVGALLDQHGQRRVLGHRRQVDSMVVANAALAGPVMSP